MSPRGLEGGQLREIADHLLHAGGIRADSGEVFPTGRVESGAVAAPDQIGEAPDPERRRAELRAGGQQE